MQQSQSKRAFLKNLLRYFGFPLAAAGVLTLAFILLQGQIVNEIRKGTYQILTDAVRQQTIVLERYVDLLETRVQLIANYDADTGPKTLVESLRTELANEAVEVEIGYANPTGELLYSDQTQANVGSEAWFMQSLAGKTVVSIGTQTVNDGLMDLRVSAYVNTHSGVRGVLFATIGNRNFSGLLSTLAYEGAANTFVSNTAGEILFVENGMRYLKAGENIEAYLGDFVLGKEITIDSIKGNLRRIISLRSALSLPEVLTMRRANGFRHMTGMCSQWCLPASRTESRAMFICIRYGCWSSYCSSEH
ncbi:MAG: hypothetical protein PHW41_00310 [Eubacteriales bacterium]|nr:hypothetical protein [Eubacteriales bacterium]